MNEKRKSPVISVESVKPNKDFRPESTVTKLLLAQFQSVQNERLVFSNLMRIFWFSLLMGTAFSSDLGRTSLVGILIVGMSLFMVTYSSSVRIDRLESNIRNAIVRLDPELDDYYINSLHEMQKGGNEAPMLVLLLRVFSRYDNIVWLAALFYLVFTNLMLDRGILVR